MAYLLGASAVMESLQRDVRDVQSCVTDIISRVGPVQCTSWKFPDKSATDLDIEDLLDLYSYSDDEEERQVAHIALYELVIDRLVLLLHSLSNYTEGILKMARADTDSGPSTGTSVGIVVKRYWAKLSQLQAIVKQNVSEKNSSHRKVTEMEDEVRRLNAELKQSYSTNRPKTAGMSSLIPPNRAEMITGMSLDPSQLKEFGLISKDEYNKSCQTNETSFTPCDSCSVVQKSFRQSGELIVSICQQQQIPSCLQRFRPQVSHLDWLSGIDISRWSAEQNKDLQRISKLTATIDPLKDEVKETRKKSEKLENRVLNFDRDMKRERDERTALNRQYEIKLKEMETQYTQTLELEKQQVELLARNKEELEKLLEKHKGQLQEQQGLLKDLESTKCKMEEELSSTKVDQSEVTKLQREMTNLQTKLDTVTDHMDQSSRDLQREQAKNKSASKHSQSLQSKQQSLLQRIDALDQENGGLRDELSQVEEEKEKIEESTNGLKRNQDVLERTLREKESEIEHVRADKESLEQTISTLETSIESLNDKLEEAKERERLIVEYPDINGPVNPDISGSGDIVVDMENQVRANNIRIQLLETQNEGLRNSVTKLLAMQQSDTQQQWHGSPAQQPQWEQPAQQPQWATHVQSRKPQPLWNPAYREDGDGNQNCQQDAEYSYMENKYNQAQSYAQSNNQSNVQNRYNQSQSDSRLDNQSGAKGQGQSKKHPGIQTYQFDSSGVKQNKSSPPNKERPPFGHRPLSGAGGKKMGDEFVVGKVVRPESAKSKRESTSSAGRSRPSTAKTYMNPQNTSSIGAYLQLKKAGKLSANTVQRENTASTRPSTGKTHIPTGNTHMRSEAMYDDEYSRQENFICDQCDKMYTRERDLEIHKSYCTG